MRFLRVLDLDDFLMANVHDYAEPIAQAALLIIRELGVKAPHIATIIGIEEEIDTRRVQEVNPATGKKFLYSMERFPGTLVETYREIARRTGQPTLEEIEIELYRIGMGAFDERRYAENVDPEARDTLEFLKGKGDVLVLCTKGDTRVQENKVRALRSAGITQYLDAIEIVDSKSAETFARIAGNFSGTKAFSAGNSYKSDIVPALEAGYTGIFLPVETWEEIGKPDELLSVVDKSRCHVIFRLREMRTRYEELR